MARNLQSDDFPEYRLVRPLGGRYSVTRLIAAGGMAEVFEAHDTVLDRKVAIKILHATYGADAEFVERFRREAMAAGKLNHPNIVQVYDWGRSDDGAAYMVMELVEGRTLRQVMNEKGALGAATACRIAEQVCAALEVARRAGIVHRDIKPENILIDRDGRAKVADFGVARALAESRATQAGVVLGTASYLAPEQVEGHAGDHRSDLYALGTVLYEMLTGSPPFRGDNPVVVAYRRVAEDVPLLRSVRDDVPEALERIVAKATARLPEDRYRSPESLAADLAPLARAEHVDLPPDRGDRTIAIPTGSAETQVIRQVKPRKPKRLRRAFVLLVALLLLAGSVPVGMRLFGTVPVPDVEGLTQEVATRTIEEAGLNPEPILRNHPSVPQGSVIDTTPPANAKARRGTKIRMVVSLGPSIVTIPNVLQKTEAEARRLLEEQNLVVVFRRVFHSTKKGLVFFIDPPRNTTVKEGTTVTVSVSNGPEQIAVPDVKGTTIAQATERLQAAGFTVKVTRADSESIPRDTVISTNPAGGAKADKGSEIVIVASNGPKTFPTPDMRGKRFADAKAELASYGLKAARSQVPSSYGDTVVGQDPTPGKKIKRGSTVVLYTA